MHRKEINTEVANSISIVGITNKYALDHSTNMPSAGQELGVGMNDISLSQFKLYISTMLNT